MRARNIFTIVVINYIVMLTISSIVELYAINEKALDVETTIRTAGDMALQQAQVIDEYMANRGNSTYAQDGIRMPSTDGTGFTYIDVFKGVYDLDPNSLAQAESIYQTLYGTHDFKALSIRTDAIRTPVKYTDQNGNTNWYYIPRVSMLGLDMLPSSNATYGIKDVTGSYVDPALAQSIFAAYGMESHIHVSNGQPYYATPMNIGLTYINPSFLGTLFENNMDLLMRTKYQLNLNTPDGGNGLLTGETYASRIRGNLDDQNPINDGEFTYLRGQQNHGDPTVLSFDGITPSISYKVIDMYDPQNDPLLIRLFGAYKGDYPTKADYLRNLDNAVINPATGQPYASKPVVVAEVTFYADVVIPYFSFTWYIG